MLNSKVSRQPRKLQIICQLYKLTRHGFEIEIFDCPSQSLKVILYPHSLSHQVYHSCQHLVLFKLWLSSMLRVWGLQDHLWSSAGVARMIPRLSRRQFVTSTLLASSCGSCIWLISIYNQEFVDQNWTEHDLWRWSLLFAQAPAHIWVPPVMSHHVIWHRWLSVTEQDYMYWWLLCADSNCDSQKLEKCSTPGKQNPTINDGLSWPPKSWPSWIKWNRWIRQRGESCETAETGKIVQSV